MPFMEDKIATLFETFSGNKGRLEALPLSGSARRYYRISDGGSTYIGVYNAALEENDLFIRFSRHFKAYGLRVPCILEVAEDGLTYLQEDLGRKTLLDVVQEQCRDGKWSEACMGLYRQALSELLRFQFVPGMDYSSCVPRPVFDRRSIQWDLNYFKYCFLRLYGAAFSEDALEDDFSALLDQVCAVPARTFMFRDFQSRNIMVKEDGVWFIDYQGGRQGALHYDVASLLYDAIVAMPDAQREELLDYYIRELQAYAPVGQEEFRRDYHRFVLIRLLQALGAFGLRGLYERKPHFLDSIAPGVQSVHHLFESGKLGTDYPEIRRIIRNISLSEG